VADLWGKNISQRTEALIGIAHPDFRAELAAGAKKRCYVVPAFAPTFAEAALAG
jgi:acyl-CoA hydrolase